MVKQLGAEAVKRRRKVIYLLVFHQIHARLMRVGKEKSRWLAAAGNQWPGPWVACGLVLASG